MTELSEEKQQHRLDHRKLEKNVVFFFPLQQFTSLWFWANHLTFPTVIHLYKKDNYTQFLSLLKSNLYYGT